MRHSVNFMLAGTLLVIAAFTSCLPFGGAKRGNTPASGNSSGSADKRIITVDTAKIQVMLWHGGHSMKTARELADDPSQIPESASNEPIGLARLRQLPSVWIGVTHTSGGAFSEARGGRQDWVGNIYTYLPNGRVFLTFPHLRTMFALYKPGVTGNPRDVDVDLGWAIRQWKSAVDPGPFIQAIVNHIRASRFDGIGFDIEEAPWQYELTAADRAMVASVELGRTYNPNNADHVSAFRADQITLLYRLLATAIQHQYPQAKMVAAYSVFQPDRITTGENGYLYAAGSVLSALEYHGVDWSALIQPATWKGEQLSAITHPLLSAANRAEVPKEFKQWLRALRGAKVVFNDQVSGATAEIRERKLADIINMAAISAAANDDTVRFAVVDQNDPPIVNPETGGTEDAPHTWNERDDAYLDEFRAILARFGEAGT